MNTTVYIATSLDGFIARENGDLDWLHAGSDGSGEDYGYTTFMETVDVVVMGRHTYEKVLTFGAWAFRKPVVVLTSRSLEIPAAYRSQAIETMTGAPAEVIAGLSARGLRHLYVDGGVTIQRFLEAGAIQRLILTRIPVLIGRGIPLFGALSRDVRLQHVQTRSYPSGLVQSEYTVAG